MSTTPGLDPPEKTSRAQPKSLETDESSTSSTSQNQRESNGTSASSHDSAYPKALSRDSFERGATPCTGRVEQVSNDSDVERAMPLPRRARVVSDSNPPRRRRVPYVLHPGCTDHATGRRKTSRKRKPTSKVLDALETMHALAADISKTNKDKSMTFSAKIERLIHLSIASEGAQNDLLKSCNNAISLTDCADFEAVKDHYKHNIHVDTSPLFSKVTDREEEDQQQVATDTDHVNTTDSGVLASERSKIKIRQRGDDIDGDNYYDFSGTSVSISDNGEFLAVGAFGVKGYSGHVRNYQFDSSTQSWVQRGQDLFGEGGGDESGRSVSMSRDGMRIAVGAPLNSGYYGHTRAFEFDSDTDRWMQLGDDIDGHTKDGQSGSSVALSGDGNHLAIGSPNDRTLSGYVKIYEFVGGAWKQEGPTLAGDQYYTCLGNSLALSDSGHRIVIGSYLDHQSDVRFVGAVGVFEYIGGEWILLGSELTGDVYYDIFGDAVDISGNGKRIIIGTPNKDDGVMENVGKAEVYEYHDDKNEWFILGSAMMGDEDHEGLGTSVSMSGDGNRIVVGSEHCDDGGSNAGCTWVFEYDPVTEEWWQIGESIYGEFPGDRAGRAVAISANGNHIAIGAPLNEYYSGHTRVYGIAYDGMPSQAPSIIVSHEPSSSPSNTPTSSPIPSHEPSSSPSEDDGCIQSHRRLRIAITTDSHGAEDNWFVVKAYVESKRRFTRKAFKRNKLKSDSRLKFEKCLPVDECYIFVIGDRAYDGMCCEHGKGNFRVFWGHKLIKKGNFKNGQRRRSPVFGDGCDNQIKLEEMMKDEITHDLLYYEYEGLDDELF